ncbi:putative PurR-regulated permease PerM [Kushneria sinocarnis]|uniref:Putative PurR-regulated permease PerM n=1 Tax=Kushneria sinocarnis TaxID=595502 RepID=A0A420WTG8_9GAMM|nr:AI-2E family transporter [Kushneria sinocarnis]RKQ96403.1 putative PurR-regulated permease PerM [Kushneria sinocarnis]
MDEHEPGSIRQHFPYHVVLTIASLMIIIGGLKLGATLIVPVLLALFIAVLCARPVNWLHERGLGINTSVCCVIITMLIALAAFSMLIVTRMSEFSSALPELEQALHEHYSGLVSWVAGLGLPIDAGSMSKLFDPASAARMVPLLLGGIGNALTNIVVIFILILFTLYETLDFPNKLALAINRPDASLRRFTQFSVTLQRYLLVKTVISLVTGVLVSLSCLLLGVKFGLLWGVLAFVLNYIPNIGSILAAIPAVLLTMAMPGGGEFQALLLAGAYVAINFVLGNLIEPRVMGQTLGMSTLVAFMSLVFWGWVFGPVGMFLSVPLTMSLKIALDSHPDTRWLSIMLGPTSRRRHRSRSETRKPVE